MAVSTLARTVFASLPIAGRSSAGILPIMRMMAVSDPFLPKICTRSCSSASMVSMACSLCLTCASMTSSSSFIAIRNSFFPNKYRPWRAVAHAQGRIIRGTTSVGRSGCRLRAPRSRALQPVAPCRGVDGFPTELESASRAHNRCRSGRGSGVNSVRQPSQVPPSRWAPSLVLGHAAHEPLRHRHWSESIAHVGAEEDRD